MAERKKQMEQERFMRFVHLIEGIHKNIQKFRVEYASLLGVKSVHIFWVHELLSHPEGLSAASLAASNHVDRSLISREVSALEAKGLITIARQGEGRSYNSKLTLTESGVELAKRIKEIARSIQTLGGQDINEDDLESFYNILEKLHNNLEQICQEEA